jgi:hypothetical protein
MIILKCQVFSEEKELSDNEEVEYEPGYFDQPFYKILEEELAVFDEIDICHISSPEPILDEPRLTLNNSMEEPLDLD